MINPSTFTVHQLQLDVLHKINELNKPRQRFLDMEVDVCLPLLLFTPSFVKQYICTVIHNNRLSKALIYFRPKYTLDNNGRDALYADLHRAALAGGDRLTLWGRGKASTQMMYIRCQCSIIYRGSKVDNATGSLVQRSDYRNSTYSNDRTNQRHRQKGRNASHRTGADRRLTKDEGHCTFSLAVHQDEDGYYMKAQNRSVIHQFH